MNPIVEKESEDEMHSPSYSCFHFSSFYSYYFKILELSLFLKETSDLVYSDITNTLCYSFLFLVLTTMIKLYLYCNRNSGRFLDEKRVTLRQNNESLFNN